MTPDEAIRIVKQKANGRTRYDGQRAFLDEVLVAEIERLRITSEQRGTLIEGMEREIERLVRDHRKACDDWRVELQVNSRLHEEIERLCALFRELRAAWFARHLRSNAHEREWEEEEHERRRQNQNARLLAKYLIQTEEILSGEGWPVAPMCAANMDTKAARKAAGEDRLLV